MTVISRYGALESNIITSWSRYEYQLLLYLIAMLPQRRAPPAVPAGRQVRKRGFAPPFSSEQVTAFVGQIVLSALALSVFAVYPSGRWMALPLALYCGVTAVMLSAWVYCSLIDPSANGGKGIPYCCMRQTQQKERFCRICYKTVPGLDHHCNFLSTCIGRRNYVAFVTLAVSGTIQHGLGVALCVASALSLRDRTDDELEGLGIGGIIHIVITATGALIGAISFGTLAVFHLFLILVAGQGTYDWLITQTERREQRLMKQEQRAAERAAAGKPLNAGLFAGCSTGSEGPNEAPPAAAASASSPAGVVAAGSSSSGSDSNSASNGSSGQRSTSVGGGTGLSISLPRSPKLSSSGSPARRTPKPIDPEERRKWRERHMSEATSPSFGSSSSTPHPSPSLATAAVVNDDASSSSSAAAAGSVIAVKDSVSPMASLDGGGFALTGTKEPSTSDSVAVAVSIAATGTNSSSAGGADGPPDAGSGGIRIVAV